MKLLVLGAGGQIGRELVARGRARGWRVDGYTHATLDITEKNALDRAFASGHDAAVNASAYTAVDRAEANAEIALRVNGTAAGMVAETAAAAGTHLIHLSTDYVFDGTGAEPYAEDAPPHPLNVYGRSKLDGERRVRAAHPAAIVLRTSWVFGHGQGNFAATMLRLGRREKEIRVVDDQRGAPTFAGDAAECCLRLAELQCSGESGAEGVLHFQSRPIATWHGFAKEIFRAARAAGAKLTFERLLPIASRDYPGPARRPANSVLDCTRLTALLRRHEPGWDLPDWRPPLRRVVEKLLADPQ